MSLRNRLFYPSSKGRCSQCQKRRTVWRFPLFEGTGAIPLCSECLIPLVGVKNLRRLKRLGLIAINLPPESTEGNPTLFATTTATER